MAPDEVAYGIGQALFATRFFDAQSATPTRAAVWPSSPPQIAKALIESVNRRRKAPWRYIFVDRSAGSGVGERLKT